MMFMKKILHSFRRSISAMSFVWSRELRTALRDEAVLIFIVIVPLGYPLLYSFIYNNEVAHDVPVAVIDDSGTSLSRKYIRLCDATENVRVASRCADFEEARELMRRHKVYGVVHIPRDFSSNLNQGRQTHVTAFCDASSLLYYKAISLATINVSLEMNADIKLHRARNITARQDEITSAPLRYEEVNIFNPATGMATFLLPAVLMMILQQTMMLGIGVTAGTMKERHTFRLYRPFAPGFAGAATITVARALIYVAVYAVISMYVLGMVPLMFRFTHIGHFTDIALFMLPYLTAVAFFSITFSYFIRTRESCMLLIVYLSLIFLFVSGISWPGSAVPPFWKYMSYLIPSTFGINGFVKLNSEGARLFQVAFEYRALWLQAIFYFVTACVVTHYDIKADCRSFVRAKGQCGNACGE